MRPAVKPRSIVLFAGMSEEEKAALLCLPQLPRSAVLEQALTRVVPMVDDSAGAFVLTPKSLSRSTAAHATLDRPMSILMCRHALLRSDCRACVPLFCSHGRHTDKCKHCIREAAAAAAGTATSAAALVEAMAAQSPSATQKLADKPRQTSRSQDARESTQLNDAGEQVKSDAAGTAAVASGSATGMPAAADIAAAAASAAGSALEAASPAPASSAAMQPAVKPRKKSRTQDASESTQLSGAGEQVNSAAAGTAAVASSAAIDLHAAADAGAAAIPSQYASLLPAAAAVKPKRKINRPKDLRDISKLTGDERRKAVAAAAARRRRGGG
jgi:hypothetical protein